MSMKSAKQASTLGSIVLALTLALAGMPGWAQQQGDKDFTPQVGQAGKDVIWVPTPAELVEKMLQMARITPNDFVIDLGSGDGRIAIAAAKKFGARSMGVEFNPDMVALSNREAQRQGVADRVKFVNADIFQTDFSQATIITMYLLPDLNLKLRPKLLELKPGTRIASHQFTMGEWQPDETATMEGRQALMWVIPASAAGTWALRIDDKAQERPLIIRQSFQMLSVQFDSSNATLAFADGRVRGDQVSFAINEGSARREFSGRIQGNTMYGTVRAAGSPDMRWTASLR
jgi:SAM-dependent methyltransferase